MSYITMADLGRRGGGGGRGRGGWRGYQPYWGGGGWGYPYPVAIDVVDPIGPDFDAENKARIKDITAGWAAGVREQLAKKGMGQLYIDPMGPGAREDDIDRIARPDELVDEGIPAHQALLARKAAGLGEILGPPVSDIDAKDRGGKFWTGASVLAGAAAGYAVGSMIFRHFTRK